LPIFDLDKNERQNQNTVLTNLGRTILKLAHFQILKFLNMGFGGSSSGANMIMKNNRRSRKSKTEKFQRSTGSKIGGIGFEQKISEADLEKDQKQLKNEQKEATIILAATAIFLILFGLIFFYFMR
jgi:predicted porin